MISKIKINKFLSSEYFASFFLIGQTVKVSSSYSNNTVINVQAINIFIFETQLETRCEWKYLFSKTNWKFFVPKCHILWATKYLAGDSQILLWLNHSCFLIKLFTIRDFIYFVTAKCILCIKEDYLKTTLLK